MYSSIAHVLYCASLIITCPTVFSTIVPPREAIIMDEYGQRLHGVVGPYNEGYPMSLVCESEGGDPPPEVTWWKNSIMIDDSYTLTPQHFTRNVLHFPIVRREDLMMVLICQASNSNLTSPVTSSVTLDLNLRPLDVKIYTPFKPAYVGQELHIECQSQGARPPAQITWWKGSQKLPQVKETVVREDNLTISTLTYIPVVSDNGRNISCRADNPQLRDSEIEDIWYLDVYYAPVLSLSKNINDAAIEHSNVILTCHVHANPLITKVSWRFNEDVLLNSPSTGIEINNHSLHLTSVEKRHQGYYYCQAENSEGKGKSEEIFLTIHYSPKCISPNHSIYGVLRTETRVTCEVDANPINVTFKWVLKNASQEVQTLNAVESNGTRSVAFFPAGSFLGYNTVLCWATNAVGVQKEACVFHIMPPGPPESPKQCVISNRTAECLIVQCISGNDGGLTQVFHLEIFNAEDDDLEANLTHSDVPSFNVCNLPAETSYILVIYSANDKGRSQSVVLQTNTISSLTRNQKEDILSINQVVGIIVGTICVLLLLFSAIIIVKIQIQRRQNGRTRRRDLEKSHTHLMNEFKSSKVAGAQGPDIIPEHNYFQGLSEKPAVLTIQDNEMGQRTPKGEPPPKKYEKYQPIKCGLDEDMILSDYLQTPSKLRMGADATEGEVEECCLTVETPLINDIQLTVTQWEDSYKRLGVLSTPV